MAQEQSPRYWDLFAVIFLVLGAIALGEGLLYRHLLTLKQRRAPAPVAAPVAPPPAAELAPSVPAVEAPPAAKPAPAKPKPYKLRIRSRQQPAPGAPVTYVVEGRSRQQMMAKVAVDAFLSAFWNIELVEPLATASRATRQAWASWALPRIEQVKLSKGARGLVATFRVEPEKLRKSLEIQGVSFNKPTVPSFEINTNGSYAPEEMIVNTLTASLQKNSPYYVGAAMFASPPLVEKEIGKLRLTLDDEPYAINVVKTKDFGDSVVGRSVIFYVDVLPAR